MKYFFSILNLLLLISCSSTNIMKEEVIVVEKKILSHKKDLDKSKEKDIVVKEKIKVETLKVDSKAKKNDKEIEEVIKEEVSNKEKPKKHMFGKVIKVGLLLPLSGENEQLGKALVNATEMALFETKSKNIQLLFKDSGDTLEKAIKSSIELEEEGVSIIIGPIFSFQASEIRKNLSKNIPIFSFTNDESVINEGLWALGFSPGQQIKAIFNEMSHHSITDISIIVPQNAYGDIALQESRKASILKNIKIHHIYRFDTKAKNFAEFSMLLNTESTLKYNGLFIIASGKQLKEISSRAQYRGISPKEIKYFGLSGWNNHKILGEPALFGGYFVAPQQSSYEAFVSRYFKLYDSVPIEISGLGYDILALLSIGLKDAKNIEELIKFLTSPSGFNGIFGFFKIAINGNVYRKFVSYEVMQRNFVKKRDIMP